MSSALMWLLSFSYSATANCIRGLNSKSSTVIANVLPFWSKPFPLLAISLMFVQKYIKEITYANFGNYPNILKKIYFHFFLAGVKQYVYICGMEMKTRITN